MNTEKVWGQQYPFERNQLQRTMTLVALGGLITVVAVILVRADVTAVIGISLVGAGLVCALAAVSRRRYVREARLGFGILHTRGGGFVLGSALAFCFAGAFVVLLIILE